MAENLMQVASDLKMLPDDQLQAIMQNPGSPAPQFLVLGEIQQREKTRAAAQAQQQQQPTTVAQDAMAQGGQQMISRGNMPNQMDPRFNNGGIVGYDDGGAIDFDNLNRGTSEIDYGISGKPTPAVQTTAPAAPTNPLANYSQVIQDMAKTQSGPTNFTNGGLMGRLKAMNEDPEGYKSFVLSGASKKKTHSFGMNDGGAVRPRFNPGFADGGAVGGLMPLSRDPMTGKVRFGS
jgi:hypothetical protein